MHTYLCLFVIIIRILFYSESVCTAYKSTTYLSGIFECASRICSKNNFCVLQCIEPKTALYVCKLLTGLVTLLQVIRNRTQVEDYALQDHLSLMIEKELNTGYEVFFWWCIGDLTCSTYSSDNLLLFVI